MQRHKMDMSPEDIKVALLLAKITQASIADKLDVANSTVNRVIEGVVVSHRVRTAIAKALNMDIRRIWPSTYVVQGGPRGPGRPKSY